MDHIHYKHLTTWPDYDEEGENGAFLIGPDIDTPIAITINDNPDANKARAHFFAATPKLLRALKDAESFISGFEDDPAQDGIDTVLLPRIRAAIAEAEGRAHQ